MKKLTYFAVFEPAKSGYSVYFPDLPGCVSVGKDFYETEKNAKDALNLHLYGMEKDGGAIPVPSEPSNLDIDEETVKGYIVSAITVYPEMYKNEADNKAVKTMLQFRPGLKS
jgi:predicted RNase H-like HicB family nuclease